MRPICRINGCKRSSRAAKRSSNRLRPRLSIALARLVHQARAVRVTMPIGEIKFRDAASCHAAASVGLNHHCAFRIPVSQNIDRNHVRTV